MNRRHGLWIVLAWMIPGVAGAQVPGPLLQSGVLEIGLGFREYDRALEFSNQESRLTGEQWTAAFRLGVTETFTASVQLAGGAQIYEDDGTTYLVGAALQTRLWEHGPTRLTTSIAYDRAIMVYRSGGDSDHWRQDIDWNVQVEHSLEVSHQEVTLWGGPALSFTGLQFQAPSPEYTYESRQIFGGLLGAGVILEKHVVVGLQGMWIDAFEYAFQLAYRF
jgi:hypothetical protein